MSFGSLCFNSYNKKIKEIPFISNKEYILSKLQKAISFTTKKVQLKLKSVVVFYPPPVAPYNFLVALSFPPSGTFNTADAFFGVRLLEWVVS